MAGSPSILVFLLLMVCFQHARFMRVLVIGGTGRVGNAVTERLRQMGAQVNVLARSPPKVKDSLANCTFIKGSVCDMQDLLMASAGCDAVIDVHGVTPPRFTKLTDVLFGIKSDQNHPYNVNYLAMIKLTTAMTLNNVGKLVRITGSYVDKNPFLTFAALFNLLLSQTIKWHQMGESVIRTSGINYTVIRPPRICDQANVGNGTVLHLVQGDSAEMCRQPAHIGVDDLADLCIQAITDKRLEKATVLCCSERAVDGSDVPSQPRTWNVALSQRQVCSSRCYIDAVHRITHGYIYAR